MPCFHGFSLTKGVARRQTVARRWAAGSVGRAKTMKQPLVKRAALLEANPNHAIDGEHVLADVVYLRPNNRPFVSHCVIERTRAMVGEENRL